MLSKKKILSAISLIFIVYLGYPLIAIAIHTAIPTPLLQINAGDLTLSNWANTLNQSMRGSLCQNGSHWRNCYEINTADCDDLIHSLTQGCTSKIILTLPPKLTPLVASLAGQQVGFCVGELFYKLSQDKLKPIAECQKK